MSPEEKKSKKKKKVTVPKGSAKVLGYGAIAMFLMVWVFILGVLTGRGDVNYFLQRLGLYKTDLAARLGITQTNQTPALPLPQPAEEPKALAGADPKTAPESKEPEVTPAAVAAAAKTADPPVSKTHTESAKKPAGGSHEAKKPKGANQQKQEQGRSLASKLNFQNSLDSPPRKHTKGAAKKEGKVHTASIAPHSTATEPAGGEEKKKAACAYQVKVASYRTTQEAEKAMADLKKKGVNVSLQKGKDKTGPVYILKTGKYSNKAEAEKVNKKLKEASMSGQIQEIN